MRADPIHPIRFLLNNRVVEVDDVAPTTSVLSYLRQRAARPGTKEGCAEGDCGACTVIVGELNRGKLEMKAVNACIRFLPTLDGKALFTVEDLRQPDGSLHPVQQAMVDCHGSQCGFCTPGFVMSLWGLYLANQSDLSAKACSDAAAVRRAITGNLCRCTGYRPIIEAGQRMRELACVPFDRAALTVTLQSLARRDSLHYQWRGQRFFAPRTSAEFVALRATHPDATILAGGTDVGLWVNKQLRELGDIIYTGEVAELRQFRADENGISVGAAVSLNDAYALLQPHYPEMNEMWERFASTPIRNAGTLGGNIVNGSPIGDAMPALIALGAQAKLCSTRGARQLPLEDLYLGYQKKAMAADEVLVSVEVPARRPGLLLGNYKLSKRFDSDISAVCAAFAITLDGDVITHCRIAYGGMAATPRRATHTEFSLLGARWSEAAVASAVAALATDYTPQSDMRAGAHYRMTAAGNLLYRFYLQTRPGNPLPAAQLSVFAEIAS